MGEPVMVNDATKVVFTDVDGVLNEDTTPSRTKSRCIFVDEAKILRLKEIVDATQAKIVLSSTWRYDRNDPRFNGDFLELKEALATHGLEFYSYTPEDVTGLRRGMEIKAWLGSHPEVKQFVILDDELFDFEERGLLDHLVKTDFGYGGLTEEHVKEAIEILMGSNANDNKER